MAFLYLVISDSFFNIFQMVNKPFFFFFLFFVTAFSCKQNAGKTFDYVSLKFDTTKINIFKRDSLLYTFPKFSEPLTLTNDDIKLADSLLLNAIDKFNHTESKELYEAFNRQFPIDSFIIDLQKYKRQYFPYEDNNGQRILQIVCFSKPFAEWRNKIYSGRLNDGISKFTLRINFSERKADEFYTGGYG